MNWSLIAGAMAAFLTNEIGEMGPWIARKILRLAARLEAGRGEEEARILEEMRALLDDVPGKLTRIVWALGRVGISTRFFLRRVRPGRLLRLRRSLGTMAQAAERFGDDIPWYSFPGSWAVLIGALLVRPSGAISLLLMVVLIPPQLALGVRRVRKQRKLSGE